MDPPIRMKEGVGANAVTELINNGMDLTQRESSQNRTVLHYWAGTPHYGHKSHQKDSLAVVKLLVEKGADLQALDNWSFTPLLGAANNLDGKFPNLTVLDYLLEREEYSRAEKIEAMELAGAVILKNKIRIPQFHKAFDYWRKALQLRQIDVEGSGLIQKTELNIKGMQTSEWITSAELEDVIVHPKTHMIQSFLVRLRIFSCKNLEAIKSLQWFFLPDNFFYKLWQQRRFIEIVDIIWAVLKTLFHLDPYETSSAQRMAEKVVRKLTEVLSRLARDSPDILNEDIIKTSLDLLVSATRLYGVDLNSVIQLVKIVSHLPHRLLDKDTMETISKIRDQRGRKLLHKLCISGEIFNGNLDYNLYASVRLLLNVGCDPNAIDEDMNTPLHYLAQLDERMLINDSLSITARLLLDFGAELSRKNADAKTAIELWIQHNGRKRQRSDGDELIDWKLPDWCSELPTLTSLCARVIRRNRVPHLKLPATLITIIEKHKITQ